MPIPAREFVHPEDQAALDNLRAIPLFTECLQAFMKLFPERLLHGLNMAQKVRLGPKQLPDLYGHLPAVCEQLGIEEPEFYLEMNPRPNAYTYGDTRAFVTLTSGLVEHLEPDEIRAVVAHECGHIACKHVLYQTMALLLLRFGASVFGPLAALSLPVRLALLYWFRRSELSADRASAVIMRGSRPVVDVMIRFAGGPKSITSQVDLERYMEQAAAYDKLMESQWDQLLQGLATVDLTHPLLSVRAREITKWCEGDTFRRLVADLEGGGERVARCPACGGVLKDTWKFCGHCGAPVVAAPAGAGTAAGEGGAGTAGTAGTDGTE